LLTTESSVSWGHRGKSGGRSVRHPHVADTARGTAAGNALLARGIVAISAAQLPAVVTLQNAMNGLALQVQQLS
jgi:hypothetical protein